LLGIFPAHATVATKVNAANGEVISVDQPWWAIISTDTIELKSGEIIE
jgi:hypothetical protein